LDAMILKKGKGSGCHDHKIKERDQGCNFFGEALLG